MIMIMNDANDDNIDPIVPNILILLPFVSVHNVRGENIFNYYCRYLYIWN